MKKIYAPWRTKYVEGVAHTKKEKIDPDHCIFCSKFAENKDEKHYILKRTEHAALILNLYPYSAGHLMVIPLEHKGDLDDLSSEIRTECFELTNKAIELLKKSIKPHGFNVGINIGKAGGAGIPSHIHFHIVPRWKGDTNFMPLIADTKPVSVDLNDLYERLKKELPNFF
jgi:ATP adenylyltransferase